MAYDYTTFPRKRVAAGALIYNESGEILIVKPNYRDYWLVPGGVSDENESPMETASRELQEEIGISLPIKRLLCIDYKHTVGDVLESVQFIFLAKYSGETIIQCQKELEAWRFAPVKEALSLLSQGLAKRMQWAIRAEKENTMYYLENGENPFV